MGKILKKLILVTSPPACGKTYVSKKLAENLNHVVYLDKDTLIPLSKHLECIHTFCPDAGTDEGESTEVR